MKALPEKFLQRMQGYLSVAEYEQFLDCYDRPPEKGVRLNPLKCSAEVLEKSFDGTLIKSRFSELSYIAESDEKFGNNPLHSAGAFYSQEPSASSAVTILDPQPGDRVLDLCAAPGGKSTQIASLLKGKGLLWSNEVVKSRAVILMSNIESMGIRNAVISSVYPDKLASRLQGYFDKILVDAPCSGEGMFRKNDEAIADWSEEHVISCADRQAAILDSASACLRKDGILVYSTCTFSKEENEWTVLHFLESHPDFELVPIDVPFGREGYDNLPVLRIYPMDGGEGHFVAKFRRLSENCDITDPYNYAACSKDSAVKDAVKLFGEIFKVNPWGTICSNNGKLSILPEELPDLSGLNILRAGVPLGEIAKNRIEPHHGLFMASEPEELRNVIDFSAEDKNLLSFLHGEEIDCDEKLKGYTAVCVNGITIGFGKASAGRLKNKYPKGLRYL